MRQRVLLTFLTCVFLTSLCVLLLPGRRPRSFHSLVRETQDRISALGEELIPEEPVAPSLAGSPQHLASLGLQGPGLPLLYPQGPWLAQGRASDPTIVSALEPGQGELGLGLVLSVRHFLPATSLVLYDLGLGRGEREVLERHCNSSTCSLHTFDFSPWPSHVRELHLHVYRPIAIQLVLREVGSVVWMAPDHRLTSSSLSPWVERAREVGVVAWQVGEGGGTATTALTHPRMFEFFPSTKYEDLAFQHMVSASVLLLVYTRATHHRLMLPWLQCALTEACINPIGAQDSGCRFDKKPQYRYSGCHRYDVSALNIVLGEMFQLEEGQYLVPPHTSFFRRVTQGPGTNATLPATEPDPLAA